MSDFRNSVFKEKKVWRYDIVLKNLLVSSPALSDVSGRPFSQSIIDAWFSISK